MTILRVSFPHGRYHAHPWARNPSGLLTGEWPPSPWRLLRALAAGWFRLHGPGELCGEFRDVLASLGGELPRIATPVVGFAKSVDYQPSPKMGEPKQRYENHFVAVVSPVYFRWDCQVGKELLAKVVAEVDYLGRAESVCEMAVVEEAEAPTEGWCDVSRDARGQPTRSIGEGFRDVFCPDPGDFRPGDLWRLRDSRRAGSAAAKHLVQDLLDSGTPQPDGAAWYSYRMPRGWPGDWVIRYAAPKRMARATAERVARYLEFSVQCRIPVPAEFVVSIAELFRLSAIRIRGEPSFALSGHAGPESRAGGHQHAFYLPQVDDQGRFITGLAVWSEEGFTQKEMSALMSVDVLRWADGRFPARAVLRKVSLDRPVSLGGAPARRWRSVTPFVPPRHWLQKKVVEGGVRQEDSPERQLIQTLRMAGVELECTVERAPGAASGGATWAVCRVHKNESSGQQPLRRFGFYFVLDFETPVALPFPALGHSAHFGLGQFRALTD